MKSNFLKKLAVSLLAVCLLLPCLVGCGKEPTSVYEKTVVGTVDGRDVYYDELYFLVQNYMETAKEACADRPDGLGAELDRLVRENVLTNYAILAVCESAGLSYHERELSDAVDEELEELLREDFGGEEAERAKSMEEHGLTERYLRFTIGLDLLYAELTVRYPEAGLVESDEAAVRKYIEENFVHVYHLVFFNDTEDEREANRAKAEEALSLLRSGKKSMYDLIKAGMTEDFSDPSGNGYYITRGTMDAAYEDAAFALDIGGVSDVIEAKGENNMGRLTDAFYVIGRFALDESYINTHFTALQDDYYAAAIYADMNELRAGMSFAPNDFYNSLDLTSLLPPDESGDPMTVWLWVGIGGACLVAVGAVVTVVVVKRKHRAKNANVSLTQSGKGHGKGR